MAISGGFVVSKTAVANLKNYKKRDGVYIGRANSRAGYQTSKWANPFKVTKEMPREEAIRRYAQYLREEYWSPPHPYASPTFLWIALQELRGQTLMCWCDPKRCHGHLLAELADMSEEELSEWYWQWDLFEDEAEPEQLDMFEDIEPVQPNNIISMSDWLNDK